MKIYRALLIFIVCYSGYGQLAVDSISRDETHHWGLHAVASLLFYADGLYPTLGAQYEFQYNHDIGIGLNLRGILTDDFSYSASVPFIYHATKELRVWASPGLLTTSEISYSKDMPDTVDVEGPTSFDSKTSKNFYFNMGVSWDIPLSKNKTGIFIVPYFSLDFINISNLDLNFGFIVEYQVFNVRRVEKSKHKY